MERLEIGDECVTPDGSRFRLASKRFDPELIPVYNLEVEEDHTCFVGVSPEKCVLVHNSYRDDFLKNVPENVRDLLNNNTDKIEIHHLIPQRLRGYLKDNVDALSNLRAVPESVHKQITKLQTAWFQEKIDQYINGGGSPENAAEEVYEKIVKNGEIEELNRVTERQHGKYMIASTNSARTVKSKLDQARKFSQNMDRMQKAANAARKVLNLKQLSGALLFLSAFESYAIARESMNPSEETKAALDALLNTYRNLLDEGFENGHLNKGELDSLILAMDQYLQALGILDRERYMILAPLQFKIDSTEY